MEKLKSYWVYLLGVFFIFIIFLFPNYTYASDMFEEIQINDNVTYAAVIPKTLIFNGSREQSNDCQYVIKVKGNVGANEYIYVEPDRYFDLTQKNKESITAEVIQNRTCFGANDNITATNPIIENGTVKIRFVSSGKWNGSFSFNISKVVWQDKMSSDMFTWDTTKKLVTGLTSTGITYLENNNGQLEIPSSATGIFNGTSTTGAFNGTKYPDLIKSVTFAPTITSIGNYAFNNSSITSVVFPPKLTNIGQFAFANTKQLNCDILIPNTVTTMGGNTFLNCGSTGKLFISNSLSSIGVKSFCNSSFTGDIIIPDSVTSINVSAYENTYGFDGNLYLSKNLTSIKTSAFSSDIERPLKGDLILPDTLTDISTEAFMNCTNLTGKFNLPNALKTIGHRAFFNLKNVDATTVVIPDSLETIGNSSGEFASMPFYNLGLNHGGIKNFIINNNSSFTLDNGNLYTADLVRLIYYVPKAETHYIMPKTVMYFDECSLFAATNLNSITISNEIDMYGFGSIDLYFPNVPTYIEIALNTTTKNIKKVYTYEDNAMYHTNKDNTQLIYNDGSVDFDVNNNYFNQKTSLFKIK